MVMCLAEIQRHCENAALRLKSEILPDQRNRVSAGENRLLADKVQGRAQGRCQVIALKSRIFRRGAVEIKAGGLPERNRCCKAFSGGKIDGEGQVENPVMIQRLKKDLIQPPVAVTIRAAVRGKSAIVHEKLRRRAGEHLRRDEIEGAGLSGQGRLSVYSLADSPHSRASTASNVALVRVTVQETSSSSLPGEVSPFW